MVGRGITRRHARPLGSRLLGSADERGVLLRVRVQGLLTFSVLLANLIGAVVVVVLMILVIPGPNVFTAHYAVVNWVIIPVYVVVAMAVGVVWGTKRALGSLRWAIDRRQANERDRLATLKLPWRLTRMQALLWLIAAMLFTTLYGIGEPIAIVKVALTICFGGVVVCANSYLLTEFALRPLAARALTDSPPRRPMGAGVTARSLWAWALGSAVPVVGLLTVAVFALARGDVSSTQLSITILALGAVTIVFGFGVVLLMTRATVAPIRTVSRAMATVERGDLDSEVVVFDGTELGLLQAGFNRMVAGMRERERIRDLFGRHVGHEVAQLALSRRIELGGEVREVAVLFVDIVGSTTLAASRPPTEVVGLLNRFFAVVVSEVQAHQGFVNKFEGDAALAIFGAPNALPDSAGHALAAARAMSARLRAEVPECAAGIGVAAGPVVAGNVGAESRFEYTVIGDPVNEAARLTDLSKSIPGGLVASMYAVTNASPTEADRWSETEQVTLRGRTEPTRLAVPGDSPRDT
ncbi:MAG: adenylate/guanylate cyclase domain-containing protein [Haloechinothrix sp.]